MSLEEPFGVVSLAGDSIWTLPFENACQDVWRVARSKRRVMRALQGVAY
jgi:hypothetical protein